MKISEIILLLEEKYWKIKHKKLLFDILVSLKLRNIKNDWRLFLSCTEFKKFWTTRKILYWIIRKLRSVWLLIEDWKEFIRFMSKDCRFRLEANKYLASETLQNIFDKIKFWIQNLYAKIWDFNKNNTIEKLIELWFENFKKKSRSVFWLNKTTAVNRRNVFVDYKTQKKYSLFTYLMEFWDLTAYETARKLKL